MIGPHNINQDDYPKYEVQICEIGSFVWIGYCIIQPSTEKLILLARNQIKTKPYVFYQDVLEQTRNEVQTIIKTGKANRKH